MTAILPLLLLLSSEGLTSPHCSGCAEGAAVIPRAAVAYVGQVSSFDDSTWSYELWVEEVHLGEVEGNKVTLSPNPMDACHPRQLEIGSRWLVMAKDGGWLPSCSRALVQLEPGGSNPDLSSLTELLADHQRWAHASTASLVNEFQEADTEARASLQSRVAMRDDPEAEAFWLQRLAVEPASLSVTAAERGLIEAATDDTLVRLVGELGQEPVQDDIVLQVLRHRHPETVRAPLAAVYESSDLDPLLKRELLELLEIVGLTSSLALRMLDGEQPERFTALEVLTESPDMACLEKVIQLATEGSGLAAQALRDGYLRRDATRPDSAATLYEALKGGASFSPDLQGTLGEVAVLEGDIELAEGLLRAALEGATDDDIRAQACYRLAWLLAGTGRVEEAAELASRLQGSWGKLSICSQRLPLLSHCRRIKAERAAEVLAASLEAPLRLHARPLPPHEGEQRWELALEHRGASPLGIEAYPASGGSGWWPARSLWVDGGGAPFVGTCNAVCKVIRPGESWLLPVEVRPSRASTAELHFDVKPHDGGPVIPVWTLLVPGDAGPPDSAEPPSLESCLPPETEREILDRPCPRAEMQGIDPEWIP